MDDLVGYTLGQYQVVEKLGEGGMATVYKAYQPGLNRFVALKVLPPIHARQPDFSARFQREAEAIARLNHPNILPVYDFGQEEGFSFIVMRYVEGARTLKDVMAEQLGLKQVTDLIGQIAAALDCAHRQGIIHRDIKPANVLMDGDWALLTDFGLAKIMEASVKLTGSGVGVGTPAYMSPEQGQGLEIDHRSDIYSLGIVLFEMLTGRIPHDAETPFAIVVKRVTEPLPLPRAIRPELPESVERVILKALAREPGDRFASAGAMAEALKQAVSEPAAPAAEMEHLPMVQQAAEVRLPEKTAPLPAAGQPAVVQPGAPPPVPAQAAVAPLRRAFPWKWAVIAAVAVVVTLLIVGLILGFGKGGKPVAGTVRVWEKDGSAMVYVPAGTFWMGSAEDDLDANSDEWPRNQVQVDAFWIGRTEVTNAQYGKCVEAGACSPPAELSSCARDSYYDNPEFADYPVVNVTWHQALEYATWAGGRLPTEAEWEYAARGPSGSTYPWGNDPPTDTLLNYDSSRDTTKVGSYPAGASWCGALDMAGNVWEWTQGLYQEYPYSATDGREDLDAPGSRVVRGGSSTDNQVAVHAAFRHEYDPNERHCSKGFRVLVASP